MVKCVFCSKEIPIGTGMTFVYKTGKIVKFCSKKCEKQVLKFNHKPQTTKWVTSASKK